MAGEKYTNIGKARWENANVGVIKWDPEAKAGEASVIDETTGTVYEIGGGSGDYNTLTMTVIGDSGSFNITPNSLEAADSASCAMFYDGNFVNGVTVDSGNTGECILLYVGDSTTVVPFSVVKSVTGDATYDQETGLITATGDFTVAGFIQD